MDVTDLASQSAAVFAPYGVRRDDTAGVDSTGAGRVSGRGAPKKA
jgi:hypothetical protein